MAPDTIAEVALVFNDGPVYGARAIDAEFAGKALESYQDLVSKRMAHASTNGLGGRGPVPDKAHSRLLVTDVVRGSFGFLLREARGDEPGFVASSLRETVTSVTALLAAVTENDDNAFQSALDDIDHRVFLSLRKFVETLNDSDATLRIVEGMEEHRFDRASVVKAHERVMLNSIDDTDFTRPVYLIGVIPVGRRFEATDSESQEFISGKIGPSFSQDYLERVNRGEVQLIGRNWLGQFRRRVTSRVGQRDIVTLTLLELRDPPSATPQDSSLRGSW